MSRFVVATVGSALGLLCVGGCTSSDATTAQVLPASTSSPAPRVSTDQLGALTFSIEAQNTRVVSGGETTYQLVVRNDSGGPITVASCETFVGGRALVPIDDPDAELWMEVTVDCVGPAVIEDGKTQRITETVYAHDKYGTPLKPGDYLIGREVPAVPAALFAPVTVVAPPSG